MNLLADLSFHLCPTTQTGQIAFSTKRLLPRVVAAAVVQVIQQGCFFLPKLRQSDAARASSGAKWHVLFVGL